MKDIIKALCILTVFIGGACAALYILRKYTQRSYVTVEED